MVILSVILSVIQSYCHSALPLVEVQFSDVCAVEYEGVQHVHCIDPPLRFALSTEHTRTLWTSNTSRAATFPCPRNM